jgi:hypothetical protein
MHGRADTKSSSVKLLDILGSWKGMCNWGTSVMLIRRLGNGQDAIYICMCPPVNAIYAMQLKKHH